VGVGFGAGKGGDRKGRAQCTFCIRSKLVFESARDCAKRTGYEDECGERSKPGQANIDAYQPACMRESGVCMRRWGGPAHKEQSHFRRRCGVAG
jgi:hypothetical protein